MLVNIIRNHKSYFYKASDVFKLKENISSGKFCKFSYTKDDDKIIINIENDENNEILKLLIILSPIFITIFDNSTCLNFFRENLSKSNFPYGLYPTFFEGFSKDSYFDFYKDHDKNEDIILNFDNTIDFTINYVKDMYLFSLLALMEVLFEKYTRRRLLTYFKKIRNDIVINGRRSILANDIYAFYLSKYLVNWGLDLMRIAKYKDYKRYLLIRPTYKLTNSLKRPIL